MHHFTQPWAEANVLARSNAKVASGGRFRTVRQTTITLAIVTALARVLRARKVALSKSEVLVYSVHS